MIRTKHTRNTIQFAGLSQNGGEGDGWLTDEDGNIRGYDFIGK